MIHKIFRQKENSENLEKLNFFKRYNRIKKYYLKLGIKQIYFDSLLAARKIKKRKENNSRAITLEDRNKNENNIIQIDKLINGR